MVNKYIGEFIYQTSMKKIYRCIELRSEWNQNWIRESNCCTSTLRTALVYIPCISTHLYAYRILFLIALNTIIMISAPTQVWSELAGLGIFAGSFFITETLITYHTRRAFTHTHTHTHTHRNVPSTLIWSTYTHLLLLSSLLNSITATLLQKWNWDRKKRTVPRSWAHLYIDTYSV